MIPVIDLFAGPGGLGEGFSSLKDKAGNTIFQTIMSVEKDEQAYQTLRLRSYVRKIMRDDGTVPTPYIRYMKRHDEEAWETLTSYRPELWEKACNEAVHTELVDGDNSLIELGRKRLDDFNGHIQNRPWVLIGGPPCQAYSLVGRSRRANDASLDSDPKQTLYKCYLAFIKELKPTIFIMENVKGLLSARHEGLGVFNCICLDMREAGYEIRSLVTTDAKLPKDYVVEAEKYGIPQMRHRVILLGVQKDSKTPSEILKEVDETTLRETLKGIPEIRSGFSERTPNWREMNWAKYINAAADELLKTNEGATLSSILNEVKHSHAKQLSCRDKIVSAEGRLNGWYRGRLGSHPVLANHEARTHMASDLKRYLFCAAYAEANGESARIADFPKYLYPNHKNVQNLEPGQDIKFNDRFRVQVWNRPSTTITSHIAKDGHYYIHPDPKQCRSLTVREAARLQTFPDDYLFEGNRTSQYTQVGNAVPPLLARQIAEVVAACLGKDPKRVWQE